MTRKPTFKDWTAKKVIWCRGLRSDHPKAVRTPRVVSCPRPMHRSFQRTNSSCSAQVLTFSSIVRLGTWISRILLTTLTLLVAKVAATIVLLPKSTMWALTHFHKEQTRGQLCKTSKVFCLLEQRRFRSRALRVNRARLLRHQLRILLNLKKSWKRSRICWRRSKLRRGCTMLSVTCQGRIAKISYFITK